MNRRTRSHVEASNATAVAHSLRSDAAPSSPAAAAIIDLGAGVPVAVGLPNTAGEIAQAIVFNVTSASSGEVYRLEATRSANGLRFTCTCRAGIGGQACKHRIAILAGDEDACADLDPSDYAAFRQTAHASQLPDALAAVAQAEAAVAKAQADLKRAKKHLATALDG